MIEVYRFPSGFGKEATNTYSWLRFNNLNPQWRLDGGDSTILLPVGEVESLRRIQRSEPARFGNPPAFENGTVVRIVSDTYGKRYKGRKAVVLYKHNEHDKYVVRVSIRKSELKVALGHLARTP